MTFPIFSLITVAIGAFLAGLLFVPHIVCAIIVVTFTAAIVTGNALDRSL